MNLKTILEGLLLMSGRVLGTSEMMEILKDVSDGPQPSRRELDEALELIAEEWRSREASLTLERVAEGFEFRSRPDLSPWLQKLNRPKPQRLSLPAAETLALIAYRQPVTRSDIENVRGVDTGGVLKSLLERRLIRIVGRKEEAGRPLLYATSQEFLELFGLKDLSDLPPLSEFEEAIKAQAESPVPEKEGLALADLIATPEELATMEASDRETILELEERIGDLKDVEKSIEQPKPQEEEAELAPVAEAGPASTQ